MACTATEWLDALCDRLADEAFATYCQCQTTPLYLAGHLDGAVPHRLYRDICLVTREMVLRPNCCIIVPQHVPRNLNVDGFHHWFHTILRREPCLPPEEFP